MSTFKFGSQYCCGLAEMGQFNFNPATDNVASVKAKLEGLTYGAVFANLSEGQVAMGGREILLAAGFSELQRFASQHSKSTDKNYVPATIWMFIYISQKRQHDSASSDVLERQGREKFAANKDAYMGTKVPEPKVSDFPKSTSNRSDPDLRRPPAAPSVVPYPGIVEDDWVTLRRSCHQAPRNVERAIKKGLNGSVRLRRGDTLVGLGGWAWGAIPANPGCEIVAYRIIKPLGS